MILKSNGALVGINIECVLGESGQGWPLESAAQRKNQSIVANWLGQAPNHDAAIIEIDVQDLTSQSPYTNGRKDIIETDTHVGKISLVIADTDCMPIGAVHEKDLNLARSDSEFVEPPRGAHRAP